MTAVPNAKSHHRLLDLQEKMNIFQRKTEAERRRVEELEALTAEVRDKIAKQKSATFTQEFDPKQSRYWLGGVYAVQNDNKKKKRETKIFENRLNKLRIRCSEAVAHNDTLKEQANSMRRQRLAYEEIYAKLKDQVRNRQAQLDAVMGATNDSHERRQAAQEELETLRALDHKEMEDFEKRWEQLGSVIDEQKHANDHISSAARRRAEAQQLSTAGQLDVTAEKERETQMLQRLDDLQQAVEQQTAQIAQREERVTSAEAAFARLQKFAGINDVSRLVSQFVANEDENYSLFSYIQSVNAEIEKEEEQVAKISKEMGTHRKEQEAGNQRKMRQVDALKERLGRVQGENEGVNKTYQETKATLDALLENIEALYATLGCDVGGEGGDPAAGGAAATLAGPGGISESNVLHFLGMIEAKSIEITNAHVMVTAKPTKTRKNMFGPAVKHGSKEAAARISASLAEELAGDDAEDMPLSHAELKARALREFRKGKAAVLSSAGGAASMPELHAGGGGGAGGDGGGGLSASQSAKGVSFGDLPSMT